MRIGLTHDLFEANTSIVLVTSGIQDWLIILTVRIFGNNRPVFDMFSTAFIK
jgi:hypothetical protein